MARLQSDPIFSALTRPQMFGGVTYGYAVFNLILTLEIFLITRSFWTIAFAGVVHAVGYLGCLHEPTLLRPLDRAPAPLSARAEFLVLAIERVQPMIAKS